MTEIYCKHDLLEDDCYLCKHPELKNKALPDAYVFYAKYETVCPECSMPLYPEQLAIKESNKRARHATC